MQLVVEVIMLKLDGRGGLAKRQTSFELETEKEPHDVMLKDLAYSYQEYFQHVIQKKKAREWSVFRRWKQHHEDPPRLFRRLE